MKLGYKPGLAAGLAVLALAAPAGAAPVTVNLRVEGATTTQFEGPVTTDTRSLVDGNDGSGPHPCDGTSNGGAPGPTAGAALVQAAERLGGSFRANWNAGLKDVLVVQINGETHEFDTTGDFWGFWFNHGFSNFGVCGTRVATGDEIVVASATGSESVLALSGPAAARRGDTVTVTVTDWTTGDPVAGATVAGAMTGPDGKATITLTDTGTKTFKASKAGQIRSNALSMTVVDADQPLPPSGGSGVAPDRLAPTARLLGIADHQAFARGKGPRTLKASASDASGLAAVKLRLTRRSGGRCFYFSGRRQALERTRCGRAFFFKAGDGPHVSYLLPERLGPGRYVLDLAAVDRAGNRSALARGATRVVFTVR
jgi:hypothetical protein